MKKYLFAGLLTLLPATLTLIIIVWVFDLLTTPFVDAVQYLFLHASPNIASFIQNHEKLTKLLCRLIVLVLFIFLTLVLGFLGRRYFFEPFLRLINTLFMRIPLVKGIYSLTKDISKSMLAGDQKPFKETALVPFPSGEALAIGLVTGEVPPFLKKYSNESDLVVFVPTSPHPICGFILLYPQKLVKPIDVSTEDAFKFIITCGATHFSEKHPNPPKKS